MNPNGIHKPYCALRFLHHSQADPSPVKIRMSCFKRAKQPILLKLTLRLPTGHNCSVKPQMLPLLNECNRDRYSFISFHSQTFVSSSCPTHCPLYYVKELLNSDTWLLSYVKTDTPLLLLECTWQGRFFYRQTFKRPESCVFTYDPGVYNVNKRKRLCICCVSLFVALSVILSSFQPKA